MGIKGLWQTLKPYVQDGHLGQFRGQRVAVDMYVWLHMATKDCILIDEQRLAKYFSDKQGLSESAGGSSASPSVPDLAMEDVVALSDGYIDRVVSRIESLQRYGVIPVCVFDGADIPMKSGTNEARGERRARCFRDALEKLEGNFLASGGGAGFQRYAATYKEALELLERAVDISPEVAHPLIQVLKEERHLECIVAPYEADAQLAYLAQTGYVHAALSEDSDLIAYYCPCVIAKLDFYTGRCSVLLPAQSVPSFFLTMSASHIGKRGGGPSSPLPHEGITTLSTPGPAAAAAAASPPPSPSAFTYESFLLGCVMSGCDYLPNLNKIGIKTAFKLVSHAQSLPQLLSLLESQYRFPPETLHTYRRHVLEAFYCFAHHIVYCPRRRKVVNLHPLPPNVASTLKTELVGELWPDETARKVCEECLFDPTTLRLYQGTYQPALQSYLQRTRRGQVSLTSFKGFGDLTSARVVLNGEGRGGGVKRRRGSAGLPVGAGAVSDEEADAFAGGPLRKVREAHGFIGVGAAGPTAKHGAVVVRSKYFLRGAMQHQPPCEDWDSASSASGSDGKDEEATTVHPSICSGGSNTQDTHASHEAHTTSASSTNDDETATTATTTAAAARSLPHGLSTPAISELTLASQSPPMHLGSADPCSSSDASPTHPFSPQAQQQQQKSPPAQQKSLCPFGYEQCNTAHSIFTKCFVGKGWTRGGGGGGVRSADDGQGVGEVAKSDPLSPAPGSDKAEDPATAGSPSVPQPRILPNTPNGSSSGGSHPSSPIYQCAGFRPPRSLGHKENSAAAEKKADRPLASTSIFDQLAFRRT